MVGPQSCSSSNQASMDGTGDEKAWMVPARRKHGWYQRWERRRSVDGTDDEKEEEVGTLNGPLFSLLQNVLLSRLRNGWDSNLVAPKIWCDLHLLRVLTKGRVISFLLGWEEGTPSAFASLALTTLFWVLAISLISEEGLSSLPSPLSLATSFPRLWSPSWQGPWKCLKE